MRDDGSQLTAHSRHFQVPSIVTSNTRGFCLPGPGSSWNPGVWVWCSSHEMQWSASGIPLYRTHKSHTELYMLHVLMIIVSWYHDITHNFPSVIGFRSVDWSFKVPGQRWEEDHTFMNKKIIGVTFARVGFVDSLLPPNNTYVQIIIFENSLLLFCNQARLKLGWFWWF